MKWSLGDRQKKYIVQTVSVILSLAITVALAVFIALYVNEKNRAPEEEEPFVVIFDANGGSFPNGAEYHALNAERDSLVYLTRLPTKEGCVLEYWSTDKHGSHIWYFDTETVSKDIILYAIWREAVTLVFDANGGAFVNGEGSLTVQIGKNNTPSVHAPTLEGFEFAGWYVDNTEWNGVAYDNLYIKAKWVYRDNAVLSMPEVTFGGDGFNWSAVENAQGYLVAVKYLLTSETIYQNVGNELSFEMTEIFSPGEYQVSVTAIGDGEKFVSSQPATYIYRYKCLDKPFIYYDTATNTVHWFEVENAETYAVYVNGNIEYEGTDTSFSLDGYEAGSIVEVAVRAEGFYPAISNERVTVKKLTTPKLYAALWLEGRTSIRLLFTHITGADTYILDFGGENIIEIHGYSYELSVDSELIADGKISFTLQVKDSSFTYLNSDVSETFTVELTDVEDDDTDSGMLISTETLYIFSKHF